MTYQQCGPSCRKECGKYLSAYLSEECDDCVPGCHCDVGLLYENGQCLAPSECHCLYAGISYAQGQTIKTTDKCQIWLVHGLVGWTRFRCKVGEGGGGTIGGRYFQER